MASILHLLLAQCLCFLVHPVPSAASKLLAPRVLLPYYQDLTIKYVLAAEEGCYMWSTSRPDVVTVFPIPEKNSLCSQRVVLLAHSNQPKRLNSLVIAEEKVTGRLLRCDVIVDVIHSLEIMTRSRELYVEDLPLELTVRALDKEGNTFSTLAGIHFEWVVVDENTGDVEPSSRLRIVPYWSTEYYPPEYISTLERDGQQGDMILVSGIHTGPSVIKVGIQGDHYKLIPAASVRLQVFENILLTPNSDIFLLVGTEAQFRVQKLVQGKSTEIPLPLQNYEVRLEQQDESKMPVASLDAMSITVTALQLGSATLVLTHKNLHMLGSSSITNCTLHVVEPGFLGFFILPRNRSVLEEKTVYEVSTEVYTKDSSMRVYPSQNLWIDFSFPKEFFIPLFSSENGSYHVVQANQTGTTIINATLMGVKARGKTLQKLLVPLSHNQEVQIFQQIVLKPKVLTFPNYPPGVPYHYPMQVEGGSGSFTWVCINQSVATITMKGILIITTVTGHSQIQARDVLNPFHWGESQVHVLPVSALEMHPVQAATQVGKEIHVPVMMFANAMHLKVPFTDCSLLPLQISIDKEGVFVVLEGNCTSEPPSCACLVLLAQAPGHILLTVRANTNYGSFHSEVTLSAYEPLKVLVILANKLILIFGPECYLTNTPGSADSYLFVATNPTGSVLKGSWSSTQMEVIKTMLNTPDSVICSVSFSNPSLYITASSVFHAQPVFNVETELLKELDIASKLMVFLFSFFTGLAFASMIYLGYIALVDHMRSAPVVYLLSADASPQNTSYRTISLGRYNTKPRLWSTK